MIFKSIDIPAIFATTEIWILGIIQHFILYTRFDSFEELNKKFIKIIFENDKIENVEYGVLTSRPYYYYYYYQY